MKLKVTVACLCLISIPAAFGRPQTPAPSAAGRAVPVHSHTSGIAARVGDTAFLVVKAPSFTSLSPQQKALSYWLTQASIAIDPIIYDQLSRFGLREKRLLEEIAAHPAGIDPDAKARIIQFT